APGLVSDVAPRFRRPLVGIAERIPDEPDAQLRGHRDVEHRVEVAHATLTRDVADAPSVEVRERRIFGLVHDALTPARPDADRETDRLGVERRAQPFPRRRILEGAD